MMFDRVLDLMNSQYNKHSKESIMTFLLLPVVALSCVLTC